MDPRAKNSLERRRSSPRRTTVIRACIAMTLHPSRRDKALAALRAIVGPTRGEPGCAACHVYQDAEDDCRLCFIEEWSTTEALQRRLRSRAYLNLLEIVEMAASEPDIAFDQVSGRSGIELVRAAREQA